MNKHEVIEFLGKSKRTVEKYIADGRLAVTYFNGPNGKTASFERPTVEAFKREMDVPMVRAVAAPAPQDAAHIGSTALALARPGAVDPLAALAERLAGLAALAAQYPPEPKRWAPWLTLAEAAEYSGLPAAYLLAQARSGAIRAINLGTGTKEFWRFSRRALAQ